MQDNFLFDGTVAENIGFSNPHAAREDIRRVGRIAHCEEFVEKFEKGYDTVVGERAFRLSGGERQRLSIARALVKRPEIYVFDDSFSALDVATDARLRAALKAETQDRCVILVGQRVATIAEADQIVVLEHGEIVGVGSHAELLETCPTYVEIVESQLNAAEAVA